MDNSPPILDYASPRPRVKVRLAATSVLHIEASAERYVITETLTGQNSAIAALIFSASVLLVMTLMSLNTPEMLRKDIEFMGVLALAIILLSAVVIRNTWRKTVIAVENCEFSMTATAPFMKSRRHIHASFDIVDVQVILTHPIASLATLSATSSDEGEKLGELRVIPIAGPHLHLFTDHSFFQLREIAAALIDALRLDKLPIRHAVDELAAKMGRAE